jgi:two-component system, chemotaxis family, protein-glutamate methylesterase/glutaminase
MPIRVLVVDDSAFMRRVIGEAVTSQADMELAGVAINGLDALLKVEQLQPDVVTLDVEMPEMDGLTSLRHLMARYPLPVVMLSSLTQEGAVTTLRALSIGAVDFVPKPSGSISLDFHKVREDLLNKIRVAAGARVQAPPAPIAQTLSAARAEMLRKLHAHGSSPHAGTSSNEGLSLNRGIASHKGSSSHGGSSSSREPADFDRLVVIGSSTGGPRALGTLVPALPRDGRTAYLIVQHMPGGFTKSLAERLDTTSALSVHEATDGDRLSADRAFVAPGDYHLRVSSSGVVELDAGPRVHGVRPSVDVTLESVAKHFASRSVVAVLTGMGQDGGAGAAHVHGLGGFVLAEDESTCVVWGMPRAVVERNVADKVVPLDAMAQAITAAVARGARVYA